ncbi:hypothetical protein HK104_011415 [Borealophlyctis nickersoniae]|nr:hypothetical protein HK104_011415 [Borealophlyctis nickersoniae]
MERSTKPDSHQQPQHSDLSTQLLSAKSAEEIIRILSTVAKQAAPACHTAPPEGESSQTATESPVDMDPVATKAGSEGGATKPANTSAASSPDRNKSPDRARSPKTKGVPSAVPPSSQNDVPVAPAKKRVAVKQEPEDDETRSSATAIRSSAHTGSSPTDRPQRTAGDKTQKITSPNADKAASVATLRTRNDDYLKCTRELLGYQSKLSGARSRCSALKKSMEEAEELLAKRKEAYYEALEEVQGLQAVEKYLAARNEELKVQLSESRRAVDELNAKETTRATPPREFQRREEYEKYAADREKLSLRETALAVRTTQPGTGKTVTLKRERTTSPVSGEEPGGAGGVMGGVGPGPIGWMDPPSVPRGPISDFVASRRKSVPSPPPKPLVCTAFQHGMCRRPQEACSLLHVHPGDTPSPLDHLRSGWGPDPAHAPPPLPYPRNQPSANSSANSPLPPSNFPPGPPFFPGFFPPPHGFVPSPDMMSPNGKRQRMEPPPGWGGGVGGFPMDPSEK